MRQTTKFYAVLLCAALGFSTSIQSCKDYDDDIDSLNERIDAVNKSLEDLKKDFGALAFVKDVKWDESTRTLTITPATGNPVTILRMETPNILWKQKQRVKLLPLL